MAFPWAQAIPLGTSLLGSLFGGKGKQNPLAKLTQKQLMRLLGMVEKDDVYARIEEARQSALSFGTQLGEQAIGNVLADYSAGGGQLFLPDTARTGAIAGAVSNVALNLAPQVYQDRLNGFERWLQNNLAVIGQTTAGKGSPIPSVGGVQINPATVASQFSELLKNL